MSQVGKALVLTLIAFVVGTSALVAQADPGPGSPIPADDPFYSWDSSLDVAPGAVLRSRPMTFATPTLTTPIRGEQVLYRTTDQQGDAVVTVATVLRPLVPGPTKIVSYHMAYDALGSQCDPSYTLSGGATSPIATAEQGVIAGYLAAGYTVVAPDYEGEELEWTIGRQSGYAALDGIRAAQSFLQVPSSTPVAMIGYSGGSVPTQWGAEVAPTYAPELNLVGIAAGGLPVDLAHNLPYVSGSAQWAGVIPALIVAYQRAYGLDTASFLSEYGAQVIDQVDQECIAQFADDYPTLTDASMVRAPYTSLLDVPEVVEAINDNIMGTAGTPRTPMFLAVGHADPIGDTIMITADVQALAHQYCTDGVDVQYAQYDGLTHGEAFLPFEAQGLQFLTERFAGSPTHSNCATIPVGNSLAPTPVP
ncbi:lipase [Rhodococcus sp. BP-252]|nr:MULTISPECIES: lipase family protein [Rhodococcus]MBY6411962.1 lipase [Rhodococcus sp. BP-320]MBY6416410.1 lipase [Rhodococcus sp. BP-321]MBY6420784.1 lipase [Rhodococcus sp. BP-324]MBY6426434.1 lipase [Rhodococcus sp. BP-323]MBY6431433.1 lipase [Rhodococcus sp. BP-322]